ncbi:hypothetical protein K505DRAFT_148339 [Melanomma pulvis-pyrius CBS 109.77]|uniref:Uncharacterized protein n=1 Tax=Melanomma pulvis-pyrius CBS 109.77 TaxID=1314802 RepID=A0A6A6XLN3_9PLEO|nr:hypothetical protein K505DRAFT_148339 [Melanomma pulvis-pyrius CBS 109.77]
MALHPRSLVSRVLTHGTHARLAGGSSVWWRCGGCAREKKPFLFFLAMRLRMMGLGLLEWKLRGGGRLMSFYGEFVRGLVSWVEGDGKWREVGLETSLFVAFKQGWRSGLLRALLGIIWVIYVISTMPYILCLL